jgi:hypothetical protein
VERLSQSKKIVSRGNKNNHCLLQLPLGANYYTGAQMAVDDSHEQTKLAFTSGLGKFIAAKRL